MFLVNVKWWLSVICTYDGNVEHAVNCNHAEWKASLDITFQFTVYIPIIEMRQLKRKPLNYNNFWEDFNMVCNFFISNTVEVIFVFLRAWHESPQDW